MKINDFAFNIGDEVITVDGIRGKIVDICECDRCKERGFLEPVWEDDSGNTSYITKYDMNYGFEGYYKIGNYYFNPLCKSYVEQNITYYNSLLSQLEKQLKLIEELEKETVIFNE